MDVERKMAAGSWKTWTRSILFRKKQLWKQVKLESFQLSLDTKVFSRKRQLGTLLSLCSATEVPLKREIFHSAKLHQLSSPFPKPVIRTACPPQPELRTQPTQWGGGVWYQGGTGRERERERRGKCESSVLKQVSSLNVKNCMEQP